jgi:hypothetical protein
MGKLREKFFSELSPHRKIACDQRVEHEIRQQSKTWQGTGREAKKPRIALCDRLVIAIITIDATTSN